MGSRIDNEYDGSEIKQITEEDIRFYYNERENVYVPSVTTVLDMLPKKDLQFWRDQVGAEAANKIASEAATSGTKVHNGIEELCEQLQLGNKTATLDWLDEFGRKRFKRHEWEGVLKFQDFYDNYVDTILFTETRVASIGYGIGGTIDLGAVLKDGRVALIDHKFSNNLADTYSVQTYIYKMLAEEAFGVKFDVRGNLWLKAQSRGADKTGKKIQGKGWKFVEHEDEEWDKILFKCATDLFSYHVRNRELVPDIKTYPSKIVLNNKFVN